MSNRQDGRNVGTAPIHSAAKTMVRARLADGCARRTRATGRDGMLVANCHRVQRQRRLCSRGIVVPSLRAMWRRFWRSFSRHFPASMLGNSGADARFRYETRPSSACLIGRLHRLSIWPATGLHNVNGR